MIAFLSAIAPILAAWLAIQANRPGPTPVPIAPPALASSPTGTSTQAPATAFAATVSPSPSASLTGTLTLTGLPSETPTSLPRPKLIVLLVASKTSGRAPLRVRFDARESYLTDLSGQRFVCRNGTCYYTWKVYSNGQQIGKSATDSGGTFDYTFGRQGTYMVTVWICRGKNGVDCGGSGAQILVTK